MKTKHQTTRILIALFAVVLFGAGWCCRWLTETPRATTAAAGSESPQHPGAEESDLEDRAVDLENELETARNVIDQQRRVMSESESISRRLRSIEDMIALQPARFPLGDWTPSETVCEDCWFVSADGVRLHGWYLRKSEPRAIVLYLHGNAGNITHRIHVAGLLRDRLDASLLLFDYRGYGRSEGAPAIDALALDARAARDVLAKREGVASDQIMLLGRSLGGAVAVEVAASDGASALVLESTFASLREVASTYYPKWAVQLLVANRLDSAARIGSYDGPVLISHGDADRTIPYSQAGRLFAAANEPKTFVRIRGGDHNDAQSEEYYQRLEQFIEQASGR